MHMMTETNSHRPQVLSATDWNKKGRSLLELRRNYEAIECFDKAIELRGDFTLAWYNKGLALFDLKKYNESKKCFDKSVEADFVDAYDNECYPWYNKGVVLSVLAFSHVENYSFWKKAIDCFDTATRINPAFALAWRNKGYALGSLGKYEEAIKCFDEAIALEPNSADAWRNKSFATGKIPGRVQDAKECFSEAIKRDPEIALTYNSYGYFLNSLAEYEEAMRCFDVALEINPDFALAWRNKGFSLLSLNLAEKAIECVDKSIKIEPKNPYGWNYKGYAFFDLGKYQEAIRCFDNAIETEPNNADAWINKGVALFNLGKYQEAIRCFGKAVEKYDFIIKSLGENCAHTLGLPCKLAYALNSMGASFSNIEGKIDEAINCFFEAIRIFEKSNALNPASEDAIAEVFHNVGYIHALRKDYEKALEYFNEAIEIREQSAKKWPSTYDKEAKDWRNKVADDWRNMGFILSKLKERKQNPEERKAAEREAIECLKRAIEKDDKFLLAFNSYGYFLNSLGEYDEAIKYLDRAIQIQGDQKIFHFPFSHYNRGYSLYSKGIKYEKEKCYDRASKCFEDAIISFDNAIENAPDFSYAWYTKGAALNHLKRYNEAILCFDKHLRTGAKLACIEIIPEFDHTSNNKGYALYCLGRYDEAKECFDKAIIHATKHGKIDYEAWCNKGNAQLQLENYDDAIACFDKALETNPDRDVVYLSRGQSKYMLGDYSGALKDFSCIKDPTLEGEKHSSIGQCFYKLSLFEKAMEEYWLATRSNITATNATAYYNLGVLYNHENKVDVAKRMFETCLRTDRNFYKASETLRKFEKTVDRSNWFEWWFGDFRIQKLADKQSKKHNPDKSRVEEIEKSSLLPKGKGKGVLGLILLAVVLTFTLVIIVDSSESLLGTHTDTKVVAGLAGTFVGLVAILVGLLLIPTLGRLKAGATGIELDMERLSIEPTVETTELIRTTVPFEPSIYPVESFAAPLRRVRTVILQQPFLMPKRHPLTNLCMFYPP
jgi:tetratricopeptide (TPR) repeat protein